MTVATQVARASLAHVYDPALVATLREDSPLPGYHSADAIAIVVAVRIESARTGREVSLGDEQMVAIRTFGDLEDAIGSQMWGGAGE